MSAVTITTKIQSFAFKALATTSLVLFVVSLASLALVEAEKMLTVGLPLSVLLAVAAIVAYVIAPKRVLVLLEIRGDRLYVISLADPFTEFGRVYRQAIHVPIGSIRKIESSLVNVSRIDALVTTSLTTIDGTTERVYFKLALAEHVQEFFRRLGDAWPNVEIVGSGDDGRFSTVRLRPWRSWPGRKRAPTDTQGRTTKEIERKLMVVGMIDTPGVIMLGLGLYAKFAANGDAFIPLLNNQSVVNWLLGAGAAVMTWGGYMTFVLAREKGRLGQDDR